jgi:hypothetical protein
MQHNAFAYRPMPLVMLIIILISSAAHIAPAHANAPNPLYLPLITTLATPAQIALDRINYYRQLAGVPAVQLHSALAVAAQNHANYDLINHGDASAWVAGPHGEVAGKPGFTGESSGARENRSRPSPW